MKNSKPQTYNYIKEAENLVGGKVDGTYDLNCPWCWEDCSKRVNKLTKNQKVLDINYRPSEICQNCADYYTSV